MTPANPILATIIFVLALQAIILSALLILKKPRTQSNALLALLVFFFALMAINIALVNFLISYDSFHLFRYFQLELLYGIGPALYLYTKSITDDQFKVSKKDLLHFLPVVLEFLFYRTSIYRLGADGMYQTPPHPYTSIYLTEQWIGSLSISIYTLLALRILFRYQQWLKEHYSNLEKRSVNWLKIPVIMYGTFWIGWQTLTELDRFLFDKGLKDSYFLPAFVGLAAISCWIGFKGYIQSQTRVSGYSSKSSKSTPLNYSKEQIQQLQALMEKQQPYLDPDLDLSKLSELLNMNPKLISSIINQGFSKNFYEFVNHYRVENFKQRIKEKGSEKLTLLGHAMESGFKSKSTFNDVFKKMMGMTPSEYMKNVKKESERMH